MGATRRGRLLRLLNSAASRWESARGLAQSLTLARGSGRPKGAPAFGVRQPSGAFSVRLRVAQAARLCRRATRPTEREGWFEPIKTVSSSSCAPPFRSASLQPGRAGRSRHPFENTL